MFATLFTNIEVNQSVDCQMSAKANNNVRSVLTTVLPNLKFIHATFMRSSQKLKCS